MNKSVKKTNAVIAALLVLILFLYIGASCVAHGHECISENCKICAAVSLLRNLFDIIFLFAVAALLPQIKKCIFKGLFRLPTAFAEDTPVFLKVKISC